MLSPYELQAKPLFLDSLRNARIALDRLYGPALGPGKCVSADLDEWIYPDEDEDTVNDLNEIKDLLDMALDIFGDVENALSL